ncbi:hypothetical protein [Streptosporangium sp. H16]|uniref:hypothetical protein n=1 Tax=Streptosporangium sp. H16 TaxID=3444184 RepID=UPI003F791DD8
MKSPGIILIFLLVVCISSTGCAADNQTQPPQHSVTEESARGALAEAVEDVAKNGIGEFCEKFAVGINSCSSMVSQAEKDCILPDADPSITRSAAVPAKNGRVGGWVLEVEGRTRDGQRYVSEFFVISDKGKTRAQVAVYWTGLGLDNSPLGPNNTVIPRAACDPTRSQ